MTGCAAPRHDGQDEPLSAPVPGNLPSYLDMCEPEARMEQVGRWTYSVIVVHGLMQIGPNGFPWHRFGRARAERKAARELARYRRQEARRKASWTIT